MRDGLAYVGVGEQWRLRRPSSREMDQASAGVGARLLVVVFPPESWAKGEFNRLLMWSFPKVMERFSKKTGIPVLDLTEDFRDHYRDPNAREIFPKHWNSEGHRFVSDRIYAHLMEHPGLLQGRRLTSEEGAELNPFTHLMSVGGSDCEDTGELGNDGPLSKVFQPLALSWGRWPWSSSLSWVIWGLWGGVGEERIRLATTTSTENSGLLEVLLPPFEKRFGAKIDVIPVGTGKALRLAAQGDVDVVLVHAPEAEERFVSEGHGLNRRDVMYNRFVFVGPSSDPAGLKGVSDGTEALTRIEAQETLFVSRGDDSGTHKKERVLWALSGVNPEGDWYLEIGQGMGATLLMASRKGLYPDRYWNFPRLWWPTGP